MLGKSVELFAEIINDPVNSACSIGKHAYRVVS